MEGLGEEKVTLVTDSESEFLNKPMQELFRTLGIEHRTVDVGDHKALGIIDRLSRTIKEIIFKDFTERETVVWYDRLPDYVDGYNATPHGGISDMTPEEAGESRNEERLLFENIGKSEPPKSPFKPGDSVRKKLKRPVFKKGSNSALPRVCGRLKRGPR
ncbi:uncharacterized protein LOC141915218 [Tubulanus polymorphus]|uniref:uncharacterized protein LOC141915218 n=1 Tax=Tubulanus polymorphus TaxID=672921 RepID=UPI003DA3AA81